MTGDLTQLLIRERCVNQLEVVHGDLWIYRYDQHVATVEGAAVAPRSRTFGGIELRWQQWRGSHLYWSYYAALLLLQGASHQQLLGDRVVLLDGRPRPFYKLRMGLDDVVVAGVLHAPEEMTTQEFFLAAYEAPVRTGGTSTTRSV